MSVPSLRTSMTAALLPILFPRVQALQRTVGDPRDARVQGVVESCIRKSTSSSLIGFEWASCAGLIGCMGDNLTSDISSGWQAGGTIASLIPTILALVGVPSEEVVLLVFTSPPRALATCIFGINLPKQLFVPLRSDDAEQSFQNRRHKELRVPNTRFAPTSMLKTLVLDFFIFGIAGFMVWRHAVVGFQTMVTFRCEYKYLVLGWPLACAGWLIIVGLLLPVFFSKIEFTSPDGKLQSWINLLLLPYGRRVSQVPLVLFVSNSVATTPGAPSAQVVSTDLCWKIRLTLRWSNSWGWFETITETLALGIYLYATFVLSSLLFLSGKEAIIYATVMVLGQSTIRVLEAL